jgi:hypothetical protein
MWTSERPWIDIGRPARHLVRLPAGFPATAEGIELRIPGRLFSPVETECALHLSLIPEGSRVIARKVEISLVEAD